LVSSWPGTSPSSFSPSLDSSAVKLHSKSPHKKPIAASVAEDPSTHRHLSLPGVKHFVARQLNRSSIPVFAAVKDALHFGTKEAKEPLSSNIPTKSDLQPITAISVLLSKETLPMSYTLVENSVTGKLTANLNTRSFGLPAKYKIFICYKRGGSLPPIVDIGVFFPSKKEQLKNGEEIVDRTVSQAFKANLNKGTKGEKIYLYYRRQSLENAKSEDEAPIYDIGVWFEKEELPTHLGFCVVKYSSSGAYEANLNTGNPGGIALYLCSKKMIS